MPQDLGPNDRRQIEELLSEALSLQADERKALLDAAGLGAEVRSEIESLLAVAPHVNGFMSVSAAGISQDFFADSECPVAGLSLGKYRLVSELGMGGMGAVYLARREAGDFEQQVAIKMLRRELNTVAVRRNFEREKEILARLEHPNIARLLDAGTTEDGVPYLAMEYVDGIPIDQYCSRRNLGLDGRLKLFNKVASAVAFAHRNLVVHRDLKPSNILITGDGEPKLLDFGISKILDENGSLTAHMTAAGLTPAYASPEQLAGEALTTATDVYSLGVVLYKMLTGAHPFSTPTMSNGDLIKAITDGELTIPSLAGGTNAASSITPSMLKGDLDNIIVKALSHEPERRYPTVEEFAADIWRFVDGRPVAARRATLAYQLSRLYKRQKVAVIAAAIVFASIVAGSGVAVWQARSARAQAALAVIESDNAKAEQKKAEKISRFMMKIISYANPHWHAEGHRSGGEARVIDALNDLVSRIESEFANHPDVLAELHHQFCDVYRARRESDSEAKVRYHALRALELRRGYHGDWHELVAKDMAFVYWMTDKQPTDESVKMLADGIVMMRATNPMNLNLPYMLEAYIDRLLDQGNAERMALYQRHLPQSAPGDPLLAADQLFDEMLGLLRQHFPEASDQIIFQKCRGSVIKLRVGRLSGAEDFYQTCKQDNEFKLSAGKTLSASRLGWMDDFRKLSGRGD